MLHPDEKGNIYGRKLNGDMRYFITEMRKENLAKPNKKKPSWILQIWHNLLPSRLHLKFFLLYPFLEDDFPLVCEKDNLCSFQVFSSQLSFYDA